VAFSKCALHGKMYKGGASTFFLAVSNGRSRYSRRIQLCPDCSTITLDDLSRSMDKVTEGDEVFDVPETPECTNCHEIIDEPRWNVFLTAYPRGKPESQWYGLFCGECTRFLMGKYSLVE
jgi:hypothetical protein